jgi:hypothetical protein
MFRWSVTLGCDGCGIAFDTASTTARDLGDYEANKLREMARNIEGNALSCSTHRPKGWKLDLHRDDVTWGDRHYCPECIRIARSESLLPVNEKNPAHTE